MRYDSEAEKSLRGCLALHSANHPDRALTLKLLGQCRQLLDTDATLNEYLTGKVAPTDAATLVQMANLAQQPFRRLYCTAVALYCDAFTRQPWLARGHRYNAACAAALAGTAQGEETNSIDDTARAELRYCALSWLQEDLGALARHLGSVHAGTADHVHKTLLHWQKDADLAAVRDPDSLRKLPETEQVAWRNLWAQVDALLARTRPGK